MIVLRSPTCGGAESISLHRRIARLEDLSSRAVAGISGIGKAASVVGTSRHGQMNNRRSALLRAGLFGDLRPSTLERP
jgi:hypothetical protein